VTIDFATRRLCPDGACIGVIGPEGRCKVCGKLDPGAAAADGDVDTDADADADAGADAGADADADADAGTDGAFDEERELCPDGACIGLIGSDGRCRVCGRARGS
jgi:hypothetical protein